MKDSFTVKCNKCGYENIINIFEFDHNGEHYLS